MKAVRRNGLVAEEGLEETKRRGHGKPGLVHRHEKSGQFHGLMQVRHFARDDAHIFMTRQQIICEYAAGTKESIK